jgi:hypothetical protein
MSVTPKDITIEIIAPVLDVKGKKAVEKSIHKAIIRGIRRCIKDAIKLAEIIVPESDPDSPVVERPEGYSDESEALMDTYIAFMSTVIASLRTLEKKLHDKYFIPQEWAASYAKHVNEMMGVQWTKAGSKAGFIEELDNYLRGNLQTYIHAELQKKDHGTKLLYTVS